MFRRQVGIVSFQVKSRAAGTVKIITYLHDELDRTDEEAEELENQVLLLLPTTGVSTSPIDGLHCITKLQSTRR
jgi:hypothetical protein